MRKTETTYLCIAAVTFVYCSILVAVIIRACEV